MLYYVKTHGPKIKSNKQRKNWDSRHSVCSARRMNCDSGVTKGARPRPLDLFLDHGRTTSSCEKCEITKDVDVYDEFTPHDFLPLSEKFCFLRIQCV